MAYTATKRPTGWTNNVEVQCMHCKTGKLYVRPAEVKRNGGRWTCPVCKKVNGA